jgi:cytochrome P450
MHFIYVRGHPISSIALPTDRWSIAGEPEQEALGTCKDRSCALTFLVRTYFCNPAAEIEKLRSAGPVVEVRFPIVGKVWTTTTQDLADRILKDSETFTLRRDNGSVAGFQWWMPGILRTLANNMPSVDEPDHRRLRDIVDEAFRRRAVLEMEPRILAIADELADELFAEGSPADLVDRYARKLPPSVICELLGLPLADRPKRLGERLHVFHGRRRLPEPDPKYFRDEALYGKALGGRTHKWWRTPRARPPLRSSPSRPAGRDEQQDGAPQVSRDGP